MCSIWEENISGDSIFSRLYISVMCLLLRCKLKSNVCIPLRVHFSRFVFSFPFCFELFLCNGLKYFDFSLKLLQILLFNEQVLRRLISEILEILWTILQSRNADHCFFFSAFTISINFEVMEPWFQVFGCIENPRVYVIEQSDHKIKKGVCVNLVFIEFTLQTISNCIVLI